MNVPAFRPHDEDSVERADLERDVVSALGPLDEAVDVAFLAVKGAQQAARSVPDTAPPTRFRNEWHASNVLVPHAFNFDPIFADHAASGFPVLVHLNGFAMVRLK
jgi:hypothetical protein